MGISWDELPKPGMKQSQLGWFVFVFFKVKNSNVYSIRETVRTIQVGFQNVLETNRRRLCLIT